MKLLLDKIVTRVQCLKCLGIKWEILVMANYCSAILREIKEIQPVVRSMIEIARRGG